MTFFVNQNIPLHYSMEDEEYPLSEKFLRVNGIYKWTKWETSVAHL